MLLEKISNRFLFCRRSKIVRSSLTHLTASPKVVWLGAILALSLLVVSPAHAGVGGSATPTFPTTITIGTTDVAATLAVSPVLTDDDATAEAELTNIVLNPACQNAACTLTEAPGTVITLNGPITTSGTCTDAANNPVTFALGGPDGAGFYSFTPNATLQIAAGEICTIHFEIDAVGIPTVDASGNAGIQTLQRAVMDVEALATGNVGQGVGGDSTTVDFSCSVQVDKQISCDGGTTWQDVGLQSANGDGFLGCIGNLGENDIKVRYQARNTGNVGLLSCNLTESNASLGPAVPVGSIAPSTTTDFVGLTADPGLECSADLTSGEPDTATISCACDVPDIAAQNVEATDGTDFECCGAAVNKEVSCNGGPFGDSDFDGGVPGSPSCTAIDGQTVASRYQVQNLSTGSVQISCSLSDTNTGGILAAFGPGSFVVDAEQTSGFTDGFSLACSQELSQNEPNSAALSCSCTQGSLVENSASATDQEKIACGTAEFNISKLCVDQGGGNFLSQVAINNTGTTDLTCDVTDQYFTGECPPAGAGTDVAMSTPVGVNAGLSGESTGAFNVTETVCNQATVDCNNAALGVDLEPQLATAVCPVEGEGCFTRTPGYWGTHPSQTLTVVGAGLDVCGITLTNATAALAGSAIEDMCGTGGGDFKPNNTSPQQLQLIRQCTAAALNLATSDQASLQCETEFPGITATFNSCCVGPTSTCDSGKTGQQISESGCIEALDTFNNFSASTGDDFPDFLVNSSAEPEQCQIANGNGFVNPGRNLGSK